MNRLPMVVSGLMLAAAMLTQLYAGVPAAAQTSAIEEPFRTTVLGEDLSWSPCSVLGARIDGCEVTVIRGSLVDGPAEVFVRIAPGTALPRIQHSVSERGLVLEGTFLRVDQHGVVTETTRGTYWYLPPRTVHGGLRCGDSGPCITYEFYDGPADVVLVESGAAGPQLREQRQR